MPKISLVVPSYNKVRFLSECICSIQGQTFTDWECIVVSDGSPFVQEIHAAVSNAGDQRFRVVEMSRSCGVSAARNKGIKESRADLIMCVDEDDKIRADCLSILLREMADADAEIVCPQGRYFGGSDGPRRARKPSLEEILASMALLPVGSLIRRTVFDRIGYYDVNLRAREDHEWWIRVIRERVKLHICDQELYFLRRPLSSEELSASLEMCAAEKEHELAVYITRKHADLYQRYPQQRRNIMRLAWVREAEYHARSGCKPWAVWCLWNAFLLSREGKDLRRAIGASLRLLLGEAVFATLKRPAKSPRMR